MLDPANPRYSRLILGAREQSHNNPLSTQARSLEPLFFCLVLLLVASDRSLATVPALTLWSNSACVIRRPCGRGFGLSGYVLWKRPVISGR